jgi:hypothetical protein
MFSMATQELRLAGNSPEKALQKVQETEAAYVRGHAAM